MEIRWLWKQFFIIILIKYTNSTTNNNEKKKLDILNKDFADFTKLDLTINDNLNTSSINMKSNKEEFYDKISNQPHSRKKRLIWVTDDGRLALPPGTTLSITPTIAMPLVRYPPEGFLSNITISFPLTIDFDKLGLTDNQNPLGVLPPVFARSFGRAAGNMLGNYIADYLHYRTKRDVNSSDEKRFKNDNFKINFTPNNENIIPPELPQNYKHIFHGGERALLYGIVEDFISTFGMNGRACLLRAICEVHSIPIDRFGVFGEIIKLFLTATKSPFAKHIPEYVKAQEIGEGKFGPGECFPYFKDCPRGLFRALQMDKYNEHHEDPEEFNEISKKNHEDTVSGNMLSM